MKCPACESSFDSNGEITTSDIHGAVVFNCKCGGRLVVKFWPGNVDDASASCSFDASGCTK